MSRWLLITAALVACATSQRLEPAHSASVKPPRPELGRSGRRSAVATPERGSTALDSSPGDSTIAYAYEYFYYYLSKAYRIIASLVWQIDDYVDDLSEDVYSGWRGALRKSKHLVFENVRRPFPVTALLIGTRTNAGARHVADGQYSHGSGYAHTRPCRCSA